MTSYEKAKEEMEKYSNTLYDYRRHGLISELESISKFSAYVKCMIDNELCGEGFGANEMEKFNRKILR